MIVLVQHFRILLYDLRVEEVILLLEIGRSNGSQNKRKVLRMYLPNLKPYHLAEG
jgi:hypothetical protein